MTGGVACGRSRLEITSAAFSATSNNVDRCGWVAGAGIDYLLMQNVVAGVRWQHVDLGSANPSFPIGAGAPGVGVSVPMKQQYEIVKATMTLKY